MDNVNYTEFMGYTFRNGSVIGVGPIMEMSTNTNWEVGFEIYTVAGIIRFKGRKNNIVGHPRSPEKTEYIELVKGFKKEFIKAMLGEVE